ADGQDIEPVSVDEFRIGPAEVYDVLVESTEDRAYSIFAQALDRSGYALGTLAPREGMTAPVPSLEPRALLTMLDMGHAIEMEQDAGTSGHAAMAHDMPAGHDMPSGHDMFVGHDMPPGHDMPGMGEMKMSPSDRLDDPGVGLRDNGRRVLTYADL